MTPTKEFFESMIKACRTEKDKLRINYERQDAVERFCERMIQDMQEGEKEPGNEGR